MSTQATLVRAGLRRLLEYLKGERERIGELRRGGFWRPDAMAEIKQHVWLTCNRPPLIDRDARPYPDAQAVIDANINYMNQRGDPQELDRLIREVERIVTRSSPGARAGGNGPAA